MSYAFGPDEPGLHKPLEYLRSVLIPSETLEAWAIQRRVFSLTHRRLLLAATSGRLIVICRPPRVRERCDFVPKTAVKLIRALPGYPQVCQPSVA